MYNLIILTFYLLGVSAINKKQGDVVANNKCFNTKIVNINKYNYINQHGKVIVKNFGVSLTHGESKVCMYLDENYDNYVSAEIISSSEVCDKVETKYYIPEYISGICNTKTECRYKNKPIELCQKEDKEETFSKFDGIGVYEQEYSLRHGCEVKELCGMWMFEPRNVVHWYIGLTNPTHNYYSVSKCAEIRKEVVVRLVHKFSGMVQTKLIYLTNGNINSISVEDSSKPSKPSKPNKPNKPNKPIMKRNKKYRSKKTNKHGLESSFLNFTAFIPDISTISTRLEKICIIADQKGKTAIIEECDNTDNLPRTNFIIGETKCTDEESVKTLKNCYFHENVIDKNYIVNHNQCKINALNYTEMFKSNLLPKSTKTFNYDYYNGGSVKVSTEYYSHYVVFQTNSLDTNMYIQTPNKECSIKINDIYIENGYYNSKKTNKFSYKIATSSFSFVNFKCDDYINFSEMYVNDTGKIFTNIEGEFQSTKEYVDTKCFAECNNNGKKTYFKISGYFSHEEVELINYRLHTELGTHHSTINNFFDDLCSFIKENIVGGIMSIMTTIVIIIIMICLCFACIANPGICFGCFKTCFVCCGSGIKCCDSCVEKVRNNVENGDKNNTLTKVVIAEEEEKLYKKNPIEKKNVIIEEEKKIYNKIPMGTTIVNENENLKFIIYAYDLEKIQRYKINFIKSQLFKCNYNNNIIEIKRGNDLICKVKLLICSSENTLNIKDEDGFFKLKCDNITVIRIGKNIEKDYNIGNNHQFEKTGDIISIKEKNKNEIVGTILSNLKKSIEIEVCNCGNFKNDGLYFEGQMLLKFEKN